MNDVQIVSRAPLACQQAQTDAEVIKLWLGTFRSRHTRRAYQGDVKALLIFVGVELRQVRLGDMLAFAANLQGSPSSQARRLSSVKSLVGFAHRLGYLPFDVAAPVPLPAIKDRLAERIASEEQTLRMLGLERNPRNAALLRLLYVSGMRISEVCSLCWSDLTPRDDAGQFAVLGKGGKTRVILLPASMWRRLLAVRGDAPADAPLFRSRGGIGISPRQVDRIVKRAAARAGMPSGFSCHWLRHAHASHALDRGCPVHVLAATLGHSSLATTTRYTHAKPGDSSARYLVS